MSSNALAIVGLACRYPDADSPDALWQNVLAERRAFRRIPAERLRLEDYQPHPSGVGGGEDHPDSLYASRAAVLEGWEFDRVRYRVGSRSFGVADLAHWLALDVAADALADAGFEHGEGLPRDGAGVLLGNTLTGEFSRANLMRLRWPYVRRQMAAALADEGWDGDRIDAFLVEFEGRYKEPFPVTNEESLAGGLANTIAGRIANHFDLHGGGYTVDGACSSSMLALSQACTALAIGDLDVALAGGVDLSLDPFELVGFARAGALARGDMRVFDRRPTGFLPGEGCGMAVLMRYDDAVARGKRVYGVVRGWGISSDGSGGLTRPESEGQALALGRAYRRAGFGPDTVPYFEAHGTGTAVGDVAELGALTLARQRASAQDRALVGSIKALIGHTKAAAGIAGVIKATLALHHQVLPPTTGCRDPHPLVSGPSALLRVSQRAEPWPADAPLRAGVSAMGFGGINSHLVLEGTSRLRRRDFVALERDFLRSPQAAELFVLGAGDRAELAQLVERLRARAPRLSMAEMGDLAASLVKALGSERAPAFHRAALVADSPLLLEERLGTLAEWLDGEPEQAGPEPAEPRFAAGLAYARSRDEESDAPRIGFLFPGQGSPSHVDGGAWRRRFAEVEELYQDLFRTLPETELDPRETSVAQPAIATASLAGLRVLRSLGIEGRAALGHSLGELSALCWTGAWDEDALLRVATARGRAMSELGDATGSMASLKIDADEAGALVDDLGDRHGVLGIAATNGPRQTVIAGAGEAVAAAMAAAQKVAAERLRSRGEDAAGVATLLPVSHAFHSPLVAAAEPRLRAALAADPPSAEALGERRLASTITGGWLDTCCEPSRLLVEQVTAPVRFLEAFRALAEEVDVLVEVGPGQVMKGLASRMPGAPRTFALDVGGPTLDGLLETIGALFTLGVDVDLPALFEGRFLRPYELDREPRFLVNPCELAPVDESGSVLAFLPPRAASSEAAAASPAASPGAVPGVVPGAAPGTGPAPGDASDDASILETVRQLIARRTDLPAETLADSDRMLSDLHLGSIAVGELVTEAARQLDLPPPLSPTEYADASVEQLAAALSEIAANTAASSGDGAVVSAGAQGGLPEGIDGWVRPFRVDWQPRKRRRRSLGAGAGVDGSLPVPRLVASEDHPLAAALVDGPTFDPAADAGGAGDTGGEGARPILLILGADPTETDELDRLLEAGRAAVSDRVPLVLVSPADGLGGGAAFARCLHLESPSVPVLVVHVPPLDERVDGQGLAALAAELRAEMGSTLARGGYHEVRFEPAGQGDASAEAASTEATGGFHRSVPVWRLFEAAPQPAPEGAPEALMESEVVLVSGGGKGIGAECALALARERGVRLAILGRSDPETDEELGYNLDRFAAHGVDCRYFRADVTDATAVRRAVQEAEQALGPIRGLIHSAGTNHPVRVPQLRRENLERTLGPKVEGLRHLLDAVDGQGLKLLVAFGSIIGRMGLHGEADYALANEVSSRLVEQFAAAHPHCRGLCLEWSVWSGVGMGSRLADLDALGRMGITPIPVDAGVGALTDLLALPTSPVTLVVSGRFGAPPTVEVEQPEMPLHRFLERPRVHVPGVELVVDSELVSAQDPYLADHALDGEPLFPAVLGLEAITRTALVLLGSEDAPSIELTDVRFDRPVVVPEGETVTLRLVALRDPGNRQLPDTSSEAAEVSIDGTVEVALRSSRTDFRVDHFRARAHLRPVLGEEPVDTPRTHTAELLASELLDLAPDDLYGPVLFQRGRFQRVAGYRHLRATECLAEILPEARTPWFGRLLSPELLLGDPGARDATLHAIQGSIPHATVLPVAVASLAFGPGLRPEHRGRRRFVHGREVESRGRNLVWNLDVVLDDGTVVERWRGLELRAVGELRLAPGVAPALLGPYLERRLADLLPSSDLRVAVSQGGPRGAPRDPNDNEDLEARRRRSARTVSSAIGHEVELVRRPDGKPEAVGEDLLIGLAHGAGATLAVVAGAVVGGTGVSKSLGLGCDLELVTDRSDETWRDLLGERFPLVNWLVSETGESRNRAATRLWTVIESLRKAGLPADAPLVFRRATDDGWVLFGAGDRTLATVVLPAAAGSAPRVVAVLGPESQGPSTGVPSIETETSLPGGPRAEVPQGEVEADAELGDSPTIH